MPSHGKSQGSDHPITICNTFLPGISYWCFCSPFTTGPLSSWLSELKTVSDSECTTMLQSKPIRPKGATKDMVKEPSESIQEKIEDIQDKANIISKLFVDLTRYLLFKPGQELTLTPCYFQTVCWLLPST